MNESRGGGVALAGGYVFRAAIMIVCQGKAADHSARHTAGIRCTGVQSQKHENLGDICKKGRSFGLESGGKFILIGTCTLVPG